MTIAPHQHGKVDVDGVPVNLISLRHLRINKAASGRHKDLDDLEHLPESTDQAAD